MDWKTNAPAFVKFVREHQCPSFLEYGEYPFVSADEIKKALKLKAIFLNHARSDAVIFRTGFRKNRRQGELGRHTQLTGQTRHGYFG